MADWGSNCRQSVLGQGVRALALGWWLGLLLLKIEGPGCGIETAFDLGCVSEHFNTNLDDAAEGDVYCKVLNPGLSFFGQNRCSFLSLDSPLFLPS
jgi:hypothetical protein